jgi:protease I
MADNPSTSQALLSTESSAALPRISAAQLLDAPENKALRELWTEVPTNSAKFAGRKTVVISTDGV